MSADPEVSALAATLDALAYKLEQEIRAPKLSVTSEYIAALDRDHKLKADDIATYAERCRQQRHHDVLCLVLKENLARFAWDVQSEPQRIELMRRCRDLADLAYPPPVSLAAQEELLNAANHVLFQYSSSQLGEPGIGRLSRAVVEVFRAKDPQPPKAEP